MRYCFWLAFSRHSVSCVALRNLVRENHEGELQHRRGLLVSSISPFFCSAVFVLRLNFTRCLERVLLMPQWRKENCNTQAAGHYYTWNSQLLTKRNSSDSCLKLWSRPVFVDYVRLVTEESHLFPGSVILQTCLNDRQRSNSCFWLAVELIRSAGDEDGQYDKLLESKTNKEDLVAIFDSLNFLGGCAWKTNKRILDIAVHMFNNGGYEDLAIPGPVVQPEVDSISLKWASILNSKDQFS